MQNLYRILALFWLGTLLNYQLNYAQTAITSLGTITNVGATTGLTYSGTGIGPTYSSVDITYNWGNLVNNSNNLKRVDGFNTASGSFTFINNLNSIVKIRRNNNTNVSGIRSLIYAEKDDNVDPSSPPTYNLNLLPPYEDDMEKVFDGRNYNLGTDNMFFNQGVNNTNNIERLDVIFPTGLSTSNISDVGFAVFDRTRGTADDFKIAAITAIDPSTLSPTGFGNLVSVTSVDYSTSDLVPNFNYGILRKEQSDSRLLLSGTGLAPSGSQSIRGTFLTLNSLGISANQVIYGYALFGNDVNLGAPENDVLTNPSTFNTNTNSTNGGLDMVGITGVAKTNTAILVSDDADLDGVSNTTDVDDDNDGVLDTIEGKGSDPSADVDSDGIPNYLDISYASTPAWTLSDSNGDGILDFFDNDLDGLANHLDLDSDNDGVADVVEVSENNANIDSDGDGRLITLGNTSVDANGLPSALGGTAITPVNTDGDAVADFLDLDADNDGIFDVIEVGSTDSNNDGRIGVSEILDADSDGWSDIADADDPGSTVGGVIHFGNGDDNQDRTGNSTDTIPNYRDLDSDNDGITDVVEASIITILGSSVDSDNDGRLSNSVNSNGLPNGGPLTPPNTDNDVVANYLDLDSDSDGIPDLWEVAVTNPGVIASFDANFDGKIGNNSSIADTNNNGWANDSDPNNGGTIIFDGTSTGSTPRDDQDGDSLPNHLDLNSDGEGLGDMWEGFDDDNDGAALDDLIARTLVFNPINGSTATYPATDSDNDGTPDWGEDADADDIPNYLDPQSPFYFDTDEDGLIDLFDPDNNDPGTPVGKLVGCGSGPNGIPDQNSNGNPSYLDNTDVIALPVTFVSFTGELMGNKVKLEWKTLAEVNNSHFIIERSLDVQNWTEVARLNAKGEIQNLITYQVFDETPQAGTNYYRLWQVDKDGTRAAYPRWVDVAYNFTRITTIYPNPTVEKIKLKLKSNALEKVGIKVMSPTGKIMLETNYEKTTLNEEPELNIKDLPNGVYFIQVIYHNGRETLKFVKQ